MPASAQAERLRRVFTLTGALPLGVFLLAHAIVSSYALRGEWALASAEDAIDAVPGVTPLLVVFVYLPLAVHAALGVWMWVAPGPIAAFAPSPYPPSVRAWLRWTGVALLAFVAWHVAALRLHGHAHLDGGALTTLLVDDLSSTWRGVPWRGMVYLVGAGCAAFHFAAGAWGAFARTEAAREKPGRLRVAGWLAGLGGALVWLVFADAVVFHATGAPIVGSAVVDPPSIERCP